MQPKHKLIVSIIAIGALSASALLPVFSRYSAQTILVVVALGAMALWVMKLRRRSSDALSAAPRLRVVTRIGLSLKSGLTLVELDGKPLLVAHGDGFASFHSPPAAPAHFKQAMESIS